MMWRSPEEELLSTLETGKIVNNAAFVISDFRSIVPRFQPENLEMNQVFVELIKKIAVGKDATPPQIALAWVLAKKSWIVPIPGTRKLERLEENLGAVDVELTEAELYDLNEALSKIEIVGDRYPAENAKYIDK